MSSLGTEPSSPSAGTIKKEMYSFLHFFSRRRLGGRGNGKLPPTFTLPLPPWSPGPLGSRGLRLCSGTFRPSSCRTQVLRSFSDELHLTHFCISRHNMLIVVGSTSLMKPQVKDKAPACGCLDELVFYGQVKGMYRSWLCLPRLTIHEDQVHSGCGQRYKQVGGGSRM